MTGRRSRLLAGLALAPLLAVAALGPMAGSAAGATAEHVGADAGDPVEAALAWSRWGRAHGGAATVLIARADRFAEALSSGGAQAALDAPLLLTGSEQLDPRVEAEIERLGAAQAILLGGPAALSAEVEDRLRQMGVETERVEGADRTATAAALARRAFGQPRTAVLVRAFGDERDESRAFADSLGAGVFAARAGAPVLLTATERLSAATRSYLADTRPERVVIVGGAGAISTGVEGELREMGHYVQRVAGSNRFATALALHWFGYQGGRGRQAETFVVVDGTHPEAWAAGLPAAAHVDEGAVILVDGVRVPGVTADALFASGTGAGVPLTCAPLLAALACDRTRAAVDANTTDHLTATVRGDGRIAPYEVRLAPTGRPDSLCVSRPQAPHTSVIRRGGPEGPVALELLDRSATGEDPVCVYGLDPEVLAEIMAEPERFWLDEVHPLPGGDAHMTGRLAG